MLDQGHPAFSPPESDCTLWRYMNLAKLLALLDTRQLYFSRSDLFDDPYEGATSRATLAQLERELIAEGLQGAKVKEAVLASSPGPKRIVARFISVAGSRVSTSRLQCGRSTAPPMRALPSRCDIPRCWLGSRHQP